MYEDFPRVGDQPGTWRMIPSRFPPIQTFETVSSPDDLEAVMDLEGWTNDRLVVERLRGRPPDIRVVAGDVDIDSARASQTLVGGLPAEQSEALDLEHAVAEAIR